MTHIVVGQLEQAFEHPANDLRAIVADLYPDAGNAYYGRIKAVWRGGDGYNVAVGASKMRDFARGETYSVWGFLVDRAGYSKAEAGRYLLSRAGLGDDHPQTRRARRQAATNNDKEAERQAYLAQKLEDAHEVQRTGATTGHSGYLARKSVAALCETHEIADVTLSGERLPGMVYSKDKYGPFVQLALRTLEGEVTGYQRIYDDKVLPGKRDKDFIGAVQGSFVLLQPKGVSLPRDGKTLVKLLAAGYEAGPCEGVATGASIALARPKAFVFCALSKGNLEPVLAALRGRYGNSRRLDNRRKVIHMCIWGDNDDSGDGQQAAHLAALKHDAYVRLPAEQGDFNDLHQRKGLQAVRRTRKVTPDVTLAFAKELAKQKLSATKELPPFELPGPGTARIVRAPQEAGKTHQLVAALAKHPHKRVIIVVHRRSLAANVARRVEGELYSDYAAHLLRDVKRLVITFDSLYKLLLDGTLPTYDLLVFDESEQVLEHTTGRHIKHKADNLAVLETLLRDTPGIICLDADAGPLTENELRRTNPTRRIEHLRHEYRVAKGRHLDLVQERDDALEALEAETQPTWYATDSLRHARNLSAYLDDPATLTISSETSGEGDAAAYLFDPKGEAAKHQRLITTPSTGTGIDDSSGHWQHVIGTFGGRTSTPQDAMQAILRARGVKRVTVHVPRGRGTAISVSDALEGATALEAYEAEALGATANIKAPTTYERRRAEVIAQRSHRRATYKTTFALNATRLGYEVTYHLPSDLSAAQLGERQTRRDALKAAGLARYIEDRASAERIDADAAKLLEEAHSRTREQTNALEQYQLRSFYGLPDDVTDANLREMLRRDDYGAFRSQVVHYEAMLEPREVAEARAHGETALKGDRRGHMLRHDFHQRLATVIGLDADTEAQTADWEAQTADQQARRDALQAERAEATNHRKGAIDKALKNLDREASTSSTATLPTRYSAQDASVKAWAAWCTEHYRALHAAGVLTCPLEHLQTKTLEVIGDSLRRAGVIQVGDGKSKKRTYAAALASISTMRNFSRPRRQNWELLQQTTDTMFCKRLLRNNEESASGTEKVSDSGNANNVPPKPDPTTYLADLLAAGKLVAFGASRLGRIRQKVAEQDTVWLTQLAQSRELGQVLGVIPPPIAHSAPQAVA